MFGGLIATVYSVFRVGKWMKDEQDEQDSRKSAKEWGNKYYTDKKGRPRLTESGRRAKLQDFIDDADKARRDNDRKLYGWYVDSVKEHNNRNLENWEWAEKRYGKDYLKESMKKYPTLYIMFKIMSFEEWMKKGGRYHNVIGGGGR